MVQQQSPKEPIDLQVDQSQHESPPAEPEVPGRRERIRW